MSTIIISNIYSPQNLGDRAIVEGIIKYLQLRYPNDKIICFSKYFSEFPYFTNWEGGKELIHLPVDKNKFITFLYPFWDLLRFFLFLLIFKLSPNQSKKLFGATSKYCAYANAKFIVNAGGNYLFSSNSSFFSRTMLVHLLNIYLPILINKKVVSFPQSIGPFYRKYEYNLVACLLSKIDFFMTRDLASFKLLQEKKLSNIILLPDIAFFLSPMGFKRERKKQIKRILITALDWSWGVTNKNKYRYEEIINNYKFSLVSCIDYLKFNFNFDISILAHVTVATSNDLIISNEISKESKYEVPVVDFSRTSLENILSYYSQFDLVIGSRMHSCILALSLGIPTVCLSYQPKGLDLFKLLNLNEYALDANEFGFNDLQLIIKNVIDNYDVVTRIFQESVYNLVRNMEFDLNTVFNDSK